jgi:hypothetical protein
MLTRTPGRLRDLRALLQEAILHTTLRARRLPCARHAARFEIWIFSLGLAHFDRPRALSLRQPALLRLQACGIEIAKNRTDAKLIRVSGRAAGFADGAL